MKVVTKGLPVIGTVGVLRVAKTRRIILDFSVY